MGCASRGMRVGILQTALLSAVLALSPDPLAPLLRCRAAILCSGREVLEAACTRGTTGLPPLYLLLTAHCHTSHAALLGKSKRNRALV